MNGKLRVLHLEDKDMEAEIVQARLADEGLICEVTRVETREGFIAALERGGFDLILADYTLPDFDGKTALELALKQRPDVPFIFVPGTIGEDTAIELLKCGATDYILKTSLGRLAHAVRRALKDAQERIERKRAEDALKASEEKYRNLVDNAMVGIYRSNLEGKFLYVNGAMANIFECESPEEILANSVMTRFSRPGDREVLLDRLRNERKVSNIEVDVPTKSGGRKTVLISATLEGDVISGMVVDISGQKKLEEQLRQAQKMEAIGQLTGGIAHDFNNILSAIMGYGELLRGKLGTGNPLKADLEVILGAAEKAASLTHGLLAFSRKQILNAKPVDLKDIIKRVEKLLGRIIGEDIELTTTLKGGALTAVADMGQIEQVFMNLATNARDAMPKGGSLSISAEPVTMEEGFIKAHGYGEPGKYALISVADTGTGMDEETQRKIFEPFFTTKEQGKGTGLGLSMVHGIVRQHNGYINVYSEPGNGTNFKIYLPLIETTDKAEEKALPLPPPQRGTETILVAEDDAALRKLAEIVLEAYGYTVILAEDGVAAIRKFRERKDEIRLVILDMIMPKKSGRDAYEEIKKIRPGIKAIFSTGYTADRIVHDQALREKLDVILKPVSPLELLRKVREVLDR